MTADEQKTLHDRRGYLNEDFLLFHLKDSKGEKYEYHYHDFYKIIVFISGKVTYLIEGNAYALKPWDILLITNRDIHKALIETVEPYERIVIWFDPKILEKNSNPGNNLLFCFDSLSGEHRNLLRLSSEELQPVKTSLQELERAFGNNTFGSSIEKNSLFLLLTVYLNRLCMQAGPVPGLNTAQYDKTISRVINHISENVGGDLSIESLAKMFYLNRYTLMHKFKKQTGFTVHSYILQKRLLAAGACLRKGCPVMETSFECGFADYSSFARAFRKFYAVSPRQYAKA